MLRTSQSCIKLCSFCHTRCYKQDDGIEKQKVRECARTRVARSPSRFSGRMSLDRYSYDISLISLTYVEESNFCIFFFKSLLFNHKCFLCWAIKLAINGCMVEELHHFNHLLWHINVKNWLVTKTFRNESNEILISCWLKAKTINMAISYYSSGIW